VPHDHERAAKLTLAEIDAMSASEVLTWMGADDAERERAYNDARQMHFWRESLKCCTDEMGDLFLAEWDRKASEGEL
jgi:hypothetical protein